MDFFKELLPPGLQLLGTIVVVVLAYAKITNKLDSVGDQLNKFAEDAEETLKDLTKRVEFLEREQASQSTLNKLTEGHLQRIETKIDSIEALLRSRRATDH